MGQLPEAGQPGAAGLTERVVIASKGRFDRAVPAVERAEKGLPSWGSAHADEFMEATTDVWEIPPESATRVGHPAPFPVELPKRLIELYTYRDDLVLDPFMGAGSTAVAAVRTGRFYVGLDTDAAYVASAEERVAREREHFGQRADRLDWPVEVPPSAARNGKQRFTMDPARAPVSDNGSSPVDGDKADPAQEEDFQARAGREGRKAQEMAEAVLHMCGFSRINDKVRRVCGVQVNFEAFDQQGGRWLFDVSGAFTVTQRPGLRRTDTLWKALGKAAVLHAASPDSRLILLTTDRPAPNSSGHRALDALTGPGRPVRAVVSMLSPTDLKRLEKLSLRDFVGSGVVEVP